MNTMIAAIIMVASTFLFFPASKFSGHMTNLEYDNEIQHQPDPNTYETNINTTKENGNDPDNAWQKNAVQWLIDAQSPTGGWGAGSHQYQNVTDPHQVQTDPATTSFAALALLRAGGTLKDNPYKANILNALDRILTDIRNRPDNGRITSLTGTQPQVKLGQNIDASMALQFLSEISDQVQDEDLKQKVDDAAKICIDLIENSQSENGGWAGGGWAPVLQSAMANNALENAGAKYDVDEKVMENSRKYQAENMNSGEDAAGVALYAVASAQRATSAEAKEATGYLPGSMINDYANGVIEEEVLIKELQAKGISKDKADRLVNSYSVNQASTKSLQNEAIWEGFGNNGGEEYLSYMLTSEALAQQSKDEWLKWKQNIEPKFKQSQNPNGSWSGHHCITSPVFCTAAIVQALNVRT